MKKIMFAILLFTPGWAALPLSAEVMTYQGRLKESNIPVNANRNFLFEFCSTEDASSGCVASPDGSKPFQALNGLFKSTFTLPAVDLSAGPWYLRVKVETSYLSPLERLTFVPYSVYSSTAGYSAAAVQKTGGVMTGQLTLAGSSLTVTGAQGIWSAANVFAGNVVISSASAAVYGGIWASTHVYLPAGAKYYGDGSGLTGVTGASGTDSTKVLKTGDAMSGSLIMADGSTITVTGSDFSVGRSTFVIKNGYVGIGTDSPMNPLQVYSQGQYVFAANANSSDATINLVHSAGGVARINDNSGTANAAVALSIGHVNHLLVNGQGNVGISSATPSYRLVVSSGAGETGIIMSVSTGTTNLFWVAGDGAHATKFYGDGSGITGLGGAATAGTATSLAGGSIGEIPYQSAANATAMLAAGITGQVLQGNTGLAPSWTITPAITGTNISGVPWSGVLKTGSSLADLATRSAGDLNSGTLPLSRLSGITNTEIAAGAGILDTQLAAIATAGKVSAGAIAAGSLPNTVIASSIAVQSITSENQILDGAVVNADLAAGGFDLAKFTVGKLNTDYVPGTIVSTHIVDGTITNADLAGSIAYSKLNLTGAVLNADLAGLIADSNLNQIATAGKVSAGAIAAGSLPNTVIASSIAVQSITSENQILDGAVVNADLAAGGFDLAKFTVGKLKTDYVPGTIVSTHIVDGAVTNADLAGSIDVLKITGTAATLGANIFTGAQTINGPLGLLVSYEVKAGSMSVTADIDVNGVMTAGSGNNQITTAAGLLDATKLTGNLPVISGASLTGLSATQVSLGNVLNVAQIPATEKGAASGVATLDAGVLIPDAQIPSAITRDSELGAYAALAAANTFASSQTIKGPLGLLVDYGVKAGSAAITGNSFSVGGSTLVVADGKIGIGTTGPGYKLDVAGDINLTGQLWQNGTPAVFSNWTVTGSDIYRLGNVGIGTASPGGKLDVAGVIRSSSAIYPGDNGFQTLRGMYDDPAKDRTGFTSNVYIVGYSSAAKYYGDGSGLTGMPGDNLGNHVATQTLQMGAYGINTSGNITAARYEINGSTVVAILPGSSSLGIGINAGRVNAGDYNVFVGSAAGYFNTTGFFNTFLGKDSGYNNAVGSNNTFAGFQAGYKNTASFNAFFGIQAGYNNTAGNGNSFFGAYAGLYNAAGKYNSLVGYQAAQFNVTGGSNTIMGYNAGNGVISNSYDGNTLMGYQAGYGLSTGSNNILIGAQAGDAVTTGMGNIVIGYDRDTSAPAAMYELNIGGLLYGDLAAKTIGISTRAPQAALDIVSTGTGPNVYAQIWRDSFGNIVASMTAAGQLSAGLLSDTSRVLRSGDAMSGPLSVFSNMGVSGSDILTNGITISTGGAIQTTGLGHGSTAGGARGRGAVDLQTSRTGVSQVASGNYSAIAGGESNSASGLGSVVAGGNTNSASSMYSAVVGGNFNKASGLAAFVGGGGNNEAQGWGAVAFGANNASMGDYSFAAGYRSTSAVNGTFTWADSQGISVLNNVQDQVMFKAKGGFWVSTSTVYSAPGLFVDAFNRVGIGTLTPAFKLHVAAADTGAVAGLSTSGNSTDAAVYGWANSGATAVKGVASSGYAGRFEGNVLVGNSGAAPGGKLSVWGTGSSASLFVSTDSNGTTAGLVVDNAGNVGIGTDSPGSRLQVNGDLGLGAASGDSNQAIVIWLGAASTVNSGDIVIAAGNNQFTTTIVASTTSVIGVALNSVSVSFSGKIAVSGVVTVNCMSGTVGQHAVTTASAGFVTGISTPAVGASAGVFLTNCGFPMANKARLLLK